MPAFLGSGFQIYVNTASGIRAVSDFFNVFERRRTLPPPSRQRIIDEGMDTGGGLSIDEEESLPYIMTDSIGEEGQDDGYLPAPATGAPATTWEFSLTPFKFILRAVYLPIVGAVDIMVQRALPVVYKVVSIVYQALPLSSITRLNRSIRMIQRPADFAHSPNNVHKSVTRECDFCGNVYPMQYRRPYRISLRVDEPFYDAVGGRLRGNPPDPIIFAKRCSHSLILSNDELTPFKIYRFVPPITADDFYDDVPIVTHRLPVWENSHSRLPFINEMLELNVSRCGHAILNHNNIKPTAYTPSSTLDGLYHLSSDRIWRKENCGNGVRCVHCHSDSLHGWHPDIIMALRNYTPRKRQGGFGGASFDFTTFNNIYMVVYKIMRFCEDNIKADVDYTLQSCSATRLTEFELYPSPSRRHIVLVDSNATANALMERYNILTCQDNFVVVVPLYGNAVSMAGWRLVFAAVCPISAGFLIINQKLAWYDALGATILFEHKISWSSVSFAHTYPFYMGVAFVRGATSTLAPVEWAYHFYLLGYVYGWDEVMPALWESCTVFLVSDSGLPPIMAPLVTELFPAYSDVVFKIVNARGRVIGAYQADFTRQNIYYLKAMATRYTNHGRMTIAHAFSDPRPIAAATVVPDLVVGSYLEFDRDNPRFAPNTMPGENILSEISHTHGGVVFFTFGSRGDVNPILAIADYISRYGAKVTVIKLNTESEGKVLANFDDADVEPVKMALFMRAKAYLTGFADHDQCFVPFQLFTGHGITYTLAPPADIVYPFIASSNVLINFVFSALGLVFQPDVRIGAFASARTLPTSHNGKTFLKGGLNESVRGKIGAYWGGDNVPPRGYEHVPLIPPGDHAEVLKKYDTVYSKGTVGFTALASVWGVRVIAVGKGYDREYKNPYDSGAGFVAGQDPDRILLALSKTHFAYLGVWLRAHWYDLRELWNWYGPDSIGLIIFRGVMYYLYMSRLQKFSFLSTTPVSTLILMLDSRSTIPLRTFVLYLVTAKFFDVLLDALDKNYFWLAEVFVRLNLKMMSSAIAFWVAQSKGWGTGLISAFVLTNSAPTLSWFVNWVPLTLAATSYPEVGADDENLTLEFVIVYRYVPVIHVALLAERARYRYEGRVNPFGLYQLTRTEGAPHSELRFPTTLSRVTLERLMRSTSAMPYGPTWHCYTVIWDCLGSHSVKLGVGAVPFLIANTLSGLLSSAAFVVLSLFYSVATILPAVGGITYRSSGLVSLVIGSIRDAVEQLQQESSSPLHTLNSWFTRLTYLRPLMPALDV
jgi:hypothetical protein